MNNATFGPAATCEFSCRPEEIPRRPLNCRERIVPCAPTKNASMLLLTTALSRMLNSVRSTRTKTLSAGRFIKRHAARYSCRRNHVTTVVCNRAQRTGRRWPSFHFFWFLTPVTSCEAASRNGPKTLFAALNVLEGKVIGRCMPRQATPGSLGVAGQRKRFTLRDTECLRRPFARHATLGNSAILRREKSKEPKLRFGV
jgi:hypothetical protein